MNLNCEDRRRPQNVKTTGGEKCIVVMIGEKLKDQQSQGGEQKCFTGIHPAAVKHILLRIQTFS